jgi:hypothetical protein
MAVPITRWNSVNYNWFYFNTPLKSKPSSLQVKLSIANPVSNALVSEYVFFVGLQDR